MSNTPEEEIKDAVRERYGDIARRFVQAPEKTASRSCCGPSTAAAGPKAAEKAQASCCGPSAAEVEPENAGRFYSAQELTNLPETVTGASLGCGNPLAIADLKPGEVVLDLGSGGGIDCFLASRQVGPEGQVIGLDMTPDMIRLARQNAKKIGAKNVDFRFGEMEDIPLPDASVDAIISNCVINLSPDKSAVFHEAYRVLRPGGRLSVSDIVVDGDLPSAIRERLDSWAACVAGALSEPDYLARIREAGFERVEVLSRDYTDVGETAGWESAAQLLGLGDDTQAAINLVQGLGLTPRDLARKVASIKVKAFKPAQDL